MQLAKEFISFLDTYKVTGLAVAFIMGLAANTLVKSFVNNIFMPLITPAVPNGAWEAATLSLGPIVLRWGAFLSALIYFILLAVAVFFMVRTLERIRVKAKLQLKSA